MFKIFISMNLKHLFAASTRIAADLARAFFHTELANFSHLRFLCFSKIFTELTHRTDEFQ